MNSKFDIEKLRELIFSSGMSVKYRNQAKQEWMDAQKKIPYFPVAYGYSTIDYELEYQSGREGEWHDLSFIIFWDNKLAALWPLSFSIIEGQGMLSSHGLPVMPPIFTSDCVAKSRKRITKNCLDLAYNIAKAAHLDSWESAESFSDSIGMTDWHKEAMARFAKCCILHELFLDIRQDWDVIKGSFRRSYKTQINSGLKTWKVGVMTDSNILLWSEYRQLHLRCAGRVTRSTKSWDLQHREIIDRNGFMVYLQNHEGKMVGGGFFRVSCDEGWYEVGAYDRDLFDKPLGHVIQYRAIEEMKERGIRWYKLGLRSYPADIPIPTKKEIQIGDFKQGFSSHLFPRYLLKHEIKLK